MANSKWLDYEGLEYYTKKLDAKLGDYAKMSDLSNYVTSSSLGTTLSGYLPLTGGTISGDLTVTGTTTLNTGIITNRWRVQSGGQFSVEEGCQFDVSENATLLMGDGSDFKVQDGYMHIFLADDSDPSDISSTKLLTVETDGNVRKASFDTFKTALGGGGVSNGVYIAYTDSSYYGHIALPSEYDGSGTVCGVLVIDGNKQLLVAPEETSLPWWSANSGTPDVLTTTTTALACQDFDGKDNTRILYDWGITSESYAAGYCHAYSHGAIPATKWWLPALGEVLIMQRYYSDINSALSVIGGTSLSSGYYWSSTAYSGGVAWFAGVSTTNSGYYNKTSSAHVRPVSAFRFVEQL